jgi:hypothetical protein
MFAFFSAAPTKKHFLFLFVITFVLRAVMFHFFMQHRSNTHVHYQQPDSTDYHQGAICIALGNGMSMPNSNQPIFWRTPGYPLYLAPFYRWFGVKSMDFNANTNAQRAALWLQIFLCSFIPIILFYLAYALTHIYFIAWLTAWISALHIGLILASTYLLTEGLSMIFFYLFLIFFYRVLLSDTTKHKQSLAICLLAAAMLSVYAWIRPMGEFVGIIAAVMLFLFSSGGWWINTQKSIAFFAPFFVSLLPWYWRNYRLTGDWFFCPLSGIYLNCFCAPKILRRTMNIPLLDAWKYTQQLAQQELQKAYRLIQGSAKFLSPLLNRNVALPILVAHPFYFASDWVREALKTLLDLYSSQFVTFANDTFWYDPLEDFLMDKTFGCLWYAPMSWWMRLICWAEFVYATVLWIGLLGGAWVFLIKPFFTKKNSLFVLRMRWLWFVCVIIIGAVVGMTGGYGYARLRLPAEPLMIILSLIFWYWLMYRKK